jgi:transcriptional regulator with XRE-family HTH domain
MAKTVAEEYEAWDLSPLSIPARSTLYPLPPIGVGTPWVESLTSYIARLADAHCVYPGTLLDKVIVPLIPSPSPTERRRRSSWRSRDDVDIRHHPSFRGDGNKSNLINATGLRATDALAALETLTSRTDLGSLTLLVLAELLPPRGLIRLFKAWCPVCYEEWRIGKQVIYDPLLWVFHEVSVCIRHRLHLSTHCPNPHCARQLPALTWRSRPGYCAFCHCWLGRAREKVEEMSVLESPELAWQQWVTQSLGTVLATIPSVLVPPKRDRVRQIMTHIVEQLSRGNVSAFARALGTARNKIEHWCKGDRIPEIDILLRLCYRLEISFSDFLFSEGTAVQPHLKDGILPALFTPRKRVAIDKKRIYQSLEQAAAGDESPPPSLKEVGRRLGHQQTELYKINQTACHTIADRYTDYRSQRREQRLQGYRDEIEQVALQLQTQGIELTQKHIAPHMAQPGILRDPKVRELLWEVCHELEASNEIHAKDARVFPQG